MKKFTEHQTRLWNHMIRSLDDYSNGNLNLRHLVGTLESTLDAGEFKDEELRAKWYEFWEPLEVYYAVTFDKGEKPKKEHISIQIEAMKKFLTEQLEVNKV